MYRKVKVSWKKVAEATGYQVYRAAKRNGTYYRWRETVTRGYVDRKKLHEENVYYYKASAYRVVKGKKVYGKRSKVKKVRAK